MSDYNHYQNNTISLMPYKLQLILPSVKNAV